MYWLIIFFWLCVGIYDAILAIQKKETLSQQYQKLFPRWVDYIILVASAVLTWAFFGPEVFSIAISYIVIGHVVWANRERYEKGDK